MRRWLAEGRPPTPDERGAVMRLPVLFARMTFVRWMLAVPLFALPDLVASREFALEEAVTTLLAGLSTSAAVYLTSEWQLRPAFALALDRSAPPEARSLGIGPRLLLTWVLCSGVPILMVALIPVGREVDRPEGPDRADLVRRRRRPWARASSPPSSPPRPSPVRCASCGAPSTRSPRATSTCPSPSTTAPRSAACRPASTAWSRACASASSCATSTAARSAPTSPARRSSAAPRWAVQTCEVSALFVDVVGSTELARARSPERVVALLNQFFEAVVGSVHDYEGLVNKFEGDAALCVFGAPVAQEDHAQRALACARELRARIDALEGGLDAAIGVACGTVVAGNVGAEARFEYTVIGDPVNEAARLTELAKQHDERLLVSGDTVDSAGAEEAARWCADGELVLRGRDCPTRIAVPVSPRGDRMLAPAGRSARAPGLPAR